MSLSRLTCFSSLNKNSIHTYVINCQKADTQFLQSRLTTTVLPETTQSLAATAPSPLLGMVVSVTSLKHRLTAQTPQTKEGTFRPQAQFL